MSHPKPTLEYYIQLLTMITDEVNIQGFVINTGVLADGTPLKIVFRYDTLNRCALGLDLMLGDKPVEAPKTLLNLLDRYFHTNDDKQAIAKVG